MAKFIDITGNRYGSLTVLEKYDTTPSGVARWLCKCDCGNTAIVRGGNLKSGAVKSCGCLRHKAVNKTHGASKTRLYTIWYKMRNRCNNPKDLVYNRYGGRGITVCEEWNNSFESFREWAVSQGYKEELTIERVDNNKGYSPENCVWATAKTQANNRRSCVTFSHNGKTQNLMQWCKELDLDYKLVHNRIHKLGWNFERAITTPCNVDKRNRRNKWQNTHKMQYRM